MKKICVYAISKNEEKFVDRFMDAIGEECPVYVLDTGSTDNTVEMLKKRGAFVTKKIINPWRFDVARNESLKLIPDDVDICICLDLDEVIDKDFIKKINNIWKDDTTRLRYNYNWSHDDNGNPIQFTVSIGVVSSEKTSSLEVLLRQVDDAMYLAKKRGRNQVALYDEAAVKNIAKKSKPVEQNIHPIFQNEENEEISLLDSYDNKIL